MALKDIIKQRTISTLNNITEDIKTETAEEIINTTMSLRIKKLVYDLMLNHTLIQKLLTYSISMSSNTFNVIFTTKNNEQILTLDNQIFYVKGE